MCKTTPCKVGLWCDYTTGLGESRPRRLEPERFYRVGTGFYLESASPSWSTLSGPMGMMAAELRGGVDGIDRAELQAVFKSWA